MYETFKKAGILDNVKATLRKQLIDNLQASKQFQEEPVGEFKVGEFFYDRKIVGMMIADYLKTHNYNFSYSIVLPELRLASEELFSQHEILSALRVEDYEYESIHVTPGQAVSALEIFLHIIKDKKLTKRIDHSAQTEYQDERPVMEKLDDIRFNTMKKIDYFAITQTKNTQEQMLKYKKEVEERYKEQLGEEMERFKKYELAELR